MSSEISSYHYENTPRFAQFEFNSPSPFKCILNKAKDEGRRGEFNQDHHIAWITEGQRRLAPEAGVPPVLADLGRELCRAVNEC